MNAVVVYESFFGNTEQIARAIAKAANGNIKVYPVEAFTMNLISETDLLIVGSPTRGFRPCELTNKFL